MSADPPAANAITEAQAPQGTRYLEDVCVNHEALIFRRGRILAESFVPGSRSSHHYESLSRYGWFLLKNYWLRRGALPQPSGLWAIDNYSPDNYHHWIVDVLPRLICAEHIFAGESVLLLPRYYQRQTYIPFTLRACPGVGAVQWIPPRTKIRVRRLAFVPRIEGEALTAHLHEMVRRVTALSSPSGSGRRIYFTRDDAARRRAANEAEVVRVLVDCGVEIIRVAPDRPWEQVAAAASAELVIGVHGAALTNAIFMPPGGQVLELRHGDDAIFFDAYRPLVTQLGLGYRAQICRLAQPAAGLEINNADLTVDLDQLRENIAGLTAARR